MNEQLLNRVEMELSQLQSREARLRKLFPSDVLKDNSLIAEKVKYYQYVLLKYKDTKNTDELFVLRMVDKERIKLTKLLYPNLLNQLFRSFFNLLISSKIQAKYYAKELQNNSRTLYDELAKIGNKDTFVKIQPLINSGQMEINASVSR